MVIIDHALAKRVERVQAAGIARNVESFRRLYPDERVGHLILGEARAFYADIDPSICHAMGLGLAGTVDPAEIERVEEFFAGFGVPSRIQLYPFSDGWLIKQTRERGYAVMSLNQTLIRELNREEKFPFALGEVRVDLAREDQERVWVETISHGFAEGGVPLPDKVGRCIFHEPVSECWLAYVDGKPAGAAALDFDDGIATCTVGAVRPEFRGRGVHTALVIARLASAARRGCDLAVMLTAPGATSQRNAQRCGFQVAYSRVDVQASA